jgi:hypothetical protein
MAKRDPRAVLGVEPDATATQIKAAWRRLARTNHPDLTGDDPAASRLATRRMAEINDAYAALTRETDGATRTGRGAEADGTPFEPGVARRRGGPPAAKPTRPVTGRVDTSGTYRPRNQAVGNSTGRTTLRGQPPLRPDLVGREPRGVDADHPFVRDRLRHFRRPPAPSLDQAEATVIPFGKFHDHTLGQIAAFEPSYIDWVAGTVNHDPDLVSAARVIQADLDRRGIVRRARPSDDRRGRSA